MKAKRCVSCGHLLPDKMGITIDEERRIVMRNDKAVFFDRMQFTAFMVFYERRGRVVQDDLLKAQVWGDDDPLYQTFHAFLSRLRTKLIPLRLRILSHFQLGHELVEAVEGQRFACTRKR